MAKTQQYNKQWLRRAMARAQHRNKNILEVQGLDSSSPTKNVKRRHSYNPVA